MGSSSVLTGFSLTVDGFHYSLLGYHLFSAPALLTNSTTNGSESTSPFRDRERTQVPPVLTVDAKELLSCNVAPISKGQYQEEMEDYVRLENRKQHT